MTISTEHFFDLETGTFSYVVCDTATKKTAIIDSVQSYDIYSARTNLDLAKDICNYVKKNNLIVEWILETHIHADHITAASYLQKMLGGKTGIGKHIRDVLSLWIPIFNTYLDTQWDGQQFDHLFEDNEIIKLGETNIKVLFTPGHTPACVSYLIEDTIFVGDTLFMPDIGTARTDFPGGSAETMYNSIQRILELPDNTKIFICHDYPPVGRSPCFLSTIKEQKEKNILIGHGTSKECYVEKRTNRDKGKPVPKLLIPSIQTNMRCGDFGNPEKNGVQYIKTPINKI